MTKKEILLEARSIKKSFMSGTQTIEVLRGVSLSIHEGESVSIRGESGSGKTTLLNIISGLESADAGELFWEGHRLQDMNPNEIIKMRGRFLGFIFQSYHLVPELSAVENVMLQARIVGNANATVLKRAHSLLEQVGLGERKQYLPNYLSGGERQRLAVARALINNPSLILADEPTGSLDEKTGRHVMDMLLDICKDHKKTLLLVTHNPEFALRTERQLVLRFGEM